MAEPSGDGAKIGIEIVLGAYLLALILTQLFFQNQTEIAQLFAGNPPERASAAARSSVDVRASNTEDDAEKERVASTDETIEADDVLAEAEVAGEPATEQFDATDADTPAEEQARLAVPDIKFDLRSVGSGSPSAQKPSGSAVNLQKPLFLNGRQLGALSISVDNHAQVFVKKASLSQLLASEATLAPKLSQLPQTEMISFRSLRNYGISLKYDPVPDRILVQSP